MSSAREPQHPDVDPWAILDEMRVDDVRAVEPITGGLDTALFRICTAQAEYALRVFRANQVDTCEREVRAMKLARTGGIPVPEVLGRAEWNGRPALLLSWCAGRQLLTEVNARLWTAVGLGCAFGRMLAGIHAVPIAGGSDAESDAWVNWVGPDETALVEQLRRVLARSREGREGRAASLLHLDYHPANVMTAEKRITAVLDWANARVGDPRADVARTVSILRLAGSPGASRWESARSLAVRRMLEWTFMRGYQQVAGPLRDMPLFYAWAGAVMLRDLAPRDGQQRGYFDEAYFVRIRRWTERWRRRASSS